MSDQTKTCVKCGGPLEAGALGQWLSGGDNNYLSTLEFTIPSSPTTSWNPSKAFRQGMADRTFRVKAWRCAHCGYLELYAVTK